jgi:hypothetical protein
VDGDHPQQNLAKFGYTPVIKVGKILLNFCYLLEPVEEIYFSKSGKQESKHFACVKIIFFRLKKMQKFAQKNKSLQ